MPQRIRPQPNVWVTLALALAKFFAVCPLAVVLLRILSQFACSARYGASLRFATMLSRSFSQTSRKSASPSVSMWSQNRSRSARLGITLRSRSFRSMSGRYRVSSQLANLRISASSSECPCVSQSRSKTMNRGSPHRKSRFRNCGFPCESRQTISPSSTHRLPFRSRARPSHSPEKLLNVFQFCETSRTPSLSE
jgi:hypothetical protein